MIGTLLRLGAFRMNGVIRKLVSSLSSRRSEKPKPHRADHSKPAGGSSGSGTLSLAGILVFSLMPSAIPPQESPEDRPGLIDLAMRAGIGPRSPEEELTFLFSFARAGELRETLLIMADGSFQTPELSAGPAACVSLTAGMPYSLGDGASLSVWVEDGANRWEALRITLDAAHVRAHRSWVPLRIEIPEGVESLRLRFEVGPGERGDYTADWIGLAAGTDPECLFGAESG